MATQTIVLDSSPNQFFQVTLAVDGGKLTLGLRLRFNETAGYWTLTIYDKNGALLLDSIPCLTGDWPSANILGQYGYLKIGSAAFVNVSNAPVDYPGMNDLGADFHLVWGDTAA